MRRDGGSALKPFGNWYLDAVWAFTQQLADHCGITPRVHAVQGQHSTVEWFLLQEMKKSREENEDEQWLDSLWDEDVSRRGPLRPGTRGTTQHPMEFVKPGGGQQSLWELDYSGCLLCDRQDELLWAEHVICNPYTSETEGKAGKLGSWGEAKWKSGSEEAWRNHTTSIYPASALVLFHSLGKKSHHKPSAALLGSGWGGEGGRGLQQHALHPGQKMFCRKRWHQAAVRLST